MITTLLCTLPLALAAPAPTAPQDALSRSQVEKLVDQSLHWLRAQQDLSSGSYGSFEDTVAALEALTRSHRAYRTGDGPFVAKALEFVLGHQRASGAIGPAEDAETARAHTRAVVALLGVLAPDAPEAARAQGFLGDQAPAPLLAFQVPDLAADQLGALAAAQARQRRPDGSWEGSVRHTAYRVVSLSAIGQRLKALEAKAGPGEAQPLPAFAPADRARVAKAHLRGAQYLLAEQVAPGRWGFLGEADPGITAMVASALVALDRPRPDDVQTALEHALDWLASLQKEDGSIHAGQLANYVTSASVMAMAQAGRQQDAAVVARARDYLQRLQSDEGEGYGSADRFYGGVGYGGDERPDLSNLQMALEALNAAGLEAGDETYQKALTFLQRCQNRSESNDFTLADGDTTIVAGNDGGAGYAPGDSKAGYVTLRDGRKIPRSYGSMTYALLKGYLFAGLPKDDPRVEAAFQWLMENYTLDVNPGFEGSSDPTAAYQGLFYYFTTMARALDLYGEDTLVDGDGVRHAWRSELAGRLTAMQRQDGSWINANAPRWFEGNPVLATAYAMITLGTARPD